MFTLNEASSIINDPFNNFNTNIAALTKKEEKRLPWLGIEFTPINPDLAKNIKIEKPTKDGTIGLLVSYVYSGSPAEKAGIKSEDILLKIKKSKEEPIELIASKAFSFNYDLSDYGPGREYDVQIAKMRKPWKSRKNYLTFLLRAIGIGEKITISYYQNGAVIKRDMKIKIAPKDFESADKHKDDPLGITIKDVTYEARKACNMKNNDPGVVVAKVESGRPFGIAKISPYEIIESVDGIKLSSVGDFKKHVEKARKENKSKMVVTVKSLGKTRVAEINLEE
jgi:serine protease Do